MVRKAAYYNVKTYRSNTRNQHLLHPLIHQRQKYVTIKILHQHEGCISISKKDKRIVRTVWYRRDLINRTLSAYTILHEGPRYLNMQDNDTLHHFSRGSHFHTLLVIFIIQIILLS